MPQYPLPPWLCNDDRDRRTARLGVDNPRFRHLPLIKGTADGAIHVVAVTPLWPMLTDHPQAQLLNHDLGKEHYVVVNRLGDVAVLPARRSIWVGRIEFHLYMAPYKPAPEVASLMPERDNNSFRPTDWAELDSMRDQSKPPRLWRSSVRCCSSRSRLSSPPSSTSTSRPQRHN